MNYKLQCTMIFNTNKSSQSRENSNKQQKTENRKQKTENNTND